MKSTPYSNFYKIIFVFFIALCIFNCTKEQEKEDNTVTPSLNLTGHWLNKQELYGNCFGHSYPEHDNGIIEVEQNNNNLNIQLGNGVNVSGTIEGKNVQWTGKYTQGEGTLTVNTSVTVSDDGNMYTGSTNWYWKHNTMAYDCSGTTLDTGYRVDNTVGIIMMQSNPDTIVFNDTSVITCIAFTGSDHVISYDWQSNGGKISGIGSSIKWTSENTGDFMITCIIEDNDGNTDTSNINIHVKTPDYPEYRYAYTLSYLPDSNQILMFGGRTSGENRYELNDTWLYDLENHNWKYLVIKGNIPEIRCHHAMSYIGNSKCLLFGGSNSLNSTLNKTWIYDNKLKTWSQVSGLSQSPSARSAQAIEYIGNDRAIMYGGVPNGWETWLFDLSDPDWYAVTSDTIPNGRYGHDKMVFMENRNELYMFGGVYDSSGYTVQADDLWAFNTVDQKWKEIMVSGDKPLRRHHLAMAYGGNNNVILFGGIFYPNGLDDPETSSLHGDLWEFDALSQTWTQIVATGDIPDAIQAHDMVYIGNNEIFLYTGFSQYIYNTVSHKWTQY